VGAPEGRLVLAIDVGGTSVKAAVVDADHQILTRARGTSRRGPEILDAIEEVARDALDQLAAADRAAVGYVGVAMLGLVDPERGVCVRSVNLGLDELEVTGPLRERLGLPVALIHDVLAAGLAEVRLGRPDLVDPFVVVIGTGIAAVTFIGGAPVAGVTGQAGELGHVVVRPDGPACACGSRGCLEAVASAAAVARRYTELSGREVAGALEVFDRIDSDPLADQVWDETASALADGLLTVVTLLAPGALVLGGGLADAGDVLTDRVRRMLSERSRVNPVPPVVHARLGSGAGLLGAALLAHDRLTELPASASPAAPHQAPPGTVR
jgi:glucokinase